MAAGIRENYSEVQCLGSQVKKSISRRKEKSASNTMVDQVGKQLKTATRFSNRRSLATLTRTDEAQ